MTGLIKARTLRRFGRLPAGTPGEGTLMLFAKPDVGGGFRACVGIVGLRFGDDPRTVSGEVYFHWGQAEDQPGSVELTVHGEPVTVAGANLAEASGRVATVFVEANRTRAGHQHFVVTEVSWKPRRLRRR